MKKLKISNNQSRRNNGITLIALVITIIVLLILAGVTIATLTGENGILTRASEAAERTEKANVIEQAQTDILGIQAEKKDGNITKGELKTVLDTYFKTVPADYTTETVLETKDEYGNHQIAVSEIYNGKTQEVISKTESYVGYYANIDGDETIDGIIYADLAVGGSGQWPADDEWGIYEIPKVESGLKDYYISNTNYDGPFGEKAVLSPTGSGTDRFYVMALEDIGDRATYCWYDAAYDDGGKLDNFVLETTNDFGQGKTNTADVLAKWKAGEWGTQNDNGTYQDMWGEIEDEIKAGWFVPSKSEWAAFGGELGIATNYTEYGLSGWYWSSSQKGEGSAYNAIFRNECIGTRIVDDDSCVRLSTTF